MSEAGKPGVVHPMMVALRSLAEDMLSTLAFLILFAVFHNVLAATLVAILVGIGQVLRAKLKHWAIEPMQWLSLGLVVVLGGATLFTRNPHFIMVKPTLTYAAVGLVMLRPGWMNRYATPALNHLAADLFRIFGFVWAGVMLLTAVLNLVVVYAFGQVMWTWFLFIFPLASKITLVGAQYLTICTVARRRAKADLAAGALPA